VEASTRPNKISSHIEEYQKEKISMDKERREGASAWLDNGIDTETPASPRRSNIGNARGLSMRPESIFLEKELLKRGKIASSDEDQGIIDGTASKEPRKTSNQQNQSTNRVCSKRMVTPPPDGTQLKGTAKSYLEKN